MGTRSGTALIMLLVCLTACITTPDEVVMEPIHAALTSGNTAEVKEAASDRSQLDALNEYGETPLLYAVKRKKPDCVEILLARGADVNAPNPRDGETPLIAAVRNGDPAMVQKLFRAGASPDRADNEGTTPFVWAARKGDIPLVKTIREKLGAREKDGVSKALIAAAGFGHSEVLDYLLSTGGSIDLRSGTGETLLIRAARFSNAETVRMLLGKGADVNTVDDYGASALSWAARMGKADVVMILANAGASIDPVDTTGLTPLAHAVRLGHQQVVEDLLEKDARLDIHLPTGEGLIYWASFQAGIARALHEKGSAPIRVAEDSDEPILVALRYLWLARFYEGEMKSAAAAARVNMVDCYKWAADFFDMAAAVNEDSAEALRKKQAAADRTAIFLSALSFTNAQYQARMQAQQMAEIGALGNPGSTATGYGYATYYTPAAFKKSYTGDIPGYLEEAERCRQSADGCRETVNCYRMGNPQSAETAACALAARDKIQHLR